MKIKVFEYYDSSYRSIRYFMFLQQEKEQTTKYKYYKKYMQNQNNSGLGTAALSAAKELESDSLCKDKDFTTDVEKQVNELNNFINGKIIYDIDVVTETVLRHPNGGGDVIKVKWIVKYDDANEIEFDFLHNKYTKKTYSNGESFEIKPTTGRKTADVALGIKTNAGTNCAATVLASSLDCNIGTILLVPAKEKSTIYITSAAAHSNFNGFTCNAQETDRNGSPSFIVSDEDLVSFQGYTYFPITIIQNSTIGKIIVRNI